ncbi:hypothetical protein P8452_46288 [Trifolium repens]|nr:hypothetical protein P8452_46288 [Trifolium repens]
MLEMMTKEGTTSSSNLQEQQSVPSRKCSRSLVINQRLIFEENGVMGSYGGFCKYSAIDRCRCCEVDCYDCESCKYCKDA